MMSLTDLLSLDDDTGTHALRSAYDSQIIGNPEVQQNHFRWVIKTLLNRHDSYGCLPLACNPSVMNVDPKLSGQYLRQVGLSGKRVKDNRVVEAIVDHLSKPGEERFHALNLHLLNALRHQRFGAGSKRVQTHRYRFGSAMAGSHLWLGRLRQKHEKIPELMEAARAEPIPQLRRGMIANLKGQSARAFLNHARMSFPESRYTVQWIKAD